MMDNTEKKQSAEVILTPEALLKHWQGHRKLSRKVLAAFPEKELFEFNIGGMRPYSELVSEMIGLASAAMNGLTTGNWETTPLLDHFNEAEKISTKQQFLEAWDEVTEQIDNLFLNIPIAHYADVVMAFGRYESVVMDLVFYLVDNEVHHRGQGFVYLRALGIEPPAFWDRY